MGGIPVREFLRKAGGTRIAIVRSVTHDAVGGLIADDVVEQIKKEMPTAALAIHDLTHDGTRQDHDGNALVGGKLYPCEGCFAGGGRRCLLPCDRNDVESDIFEGDDKGVEIHETLSRAALIVFVAEARCGGLDTRMQRFVERLAPFRNLRDDGRGLLRDKVVAIVVAGSGAPATAAQLVGQAVGIDLSVAPGGVVALDVYDDLSKDHALAEYKKNLTVRSALEAMVANSLRLVKKLTQD